MVVKSGWKKAWDLYGRNVRGAFFGGFRSFGLGPANSVIWLLHLSFLPVTVTVGSLLKTTLDSLTRKRVSEKENAATLNALGLLGEEEINDVCDVFVTRASSSVSSQRLCKDIMKLHKSDVISMAFKKDILIKYMGAEKNNGKALHAYITNHFHVENKKKLATTATADTTPICVDEDLKKRVAAQIHLLREDPFGIGKKAKASRIEAALNTLIRDSTVVNMNNLVLALDERRWGDDTLSIFKHKKYSEKKIFSHTHSYDQVFQTNRI
jgi:hypothetical protein